MSQPDFEPDQDLVGADTPADYVISRDESDQPFLNADKAEEFDSRISDDVEGLLFLGYLTSDIEVFGHNLTIKTLRRGERLACALLIREYDETMGVGDAMEAAIVAACILTLDGRPLSAALSPEDERNPIQRIRANFSRIVKWYDPVIESIYIEYQKLLMRQAQAFRELEGK